MIYIPIILISAFISIIISTLITLKLIRVATMHLLKVTSIATDSIEDNEERKKALKFMLMWTDALVKRNRIKDMF